MVDEPLGTKAQVHVRQTDRFRQVTIFGTMIAGLTSLLIKALHTRSCPQVRLEIGVYICFAVHLLTFLLLLASFICPKCIQAMGRLVGVFYFFIVGAMIGVQYIFFSGQGCNQVAPILYYWLFTNIAAFYCLIAYGISLWAAYICWEVDEEELLIQKAMAQQRVRRIGDKEFLEKMRLAGWAEMDTEMQERLITLQQNPVQ